MFFFLVFSLIFHFPSFFFPFLKLLINKYYTDIIKKEKKKKSNLNRKRDFISTESSRRKIKSGNNKNHKKKKDKKKKLKSKNKKTQKIFCYKIQATKELKKDVFQNIIIRNSFVKKIL